MRRFLLLMLFVFLLPMAALAESSLTLSTGVTKGFEENIITVNAPQEGNLLLRICDQYRVYRTLDVPVQAGENTIVWDGLGENEEIISAGDYTLHARLTSQGSVVAQAEGNITFQRCRQAVQLALPSSDTLWQADESWFVELDLVRPGTWVMEVYAAEALAEPVAKVSREAGGYDPFKFRWNAPGLAPGSYVLRFYAEDNPAYVREIDLRVEAGSAPTPAMLVTETFMPQAGDSDERIWAIMMQPSAVINLKATSHQNVYARADKSSPVLGTLHGQSQAVNVLEIGEAWVRISAWNHESGDLVEGYVPRERLMMAEPSREYGLLLDKQAQTLTIYRRGEKLTVLSISTGRVAPNKLIRETPAGVYLTLEHMGEFSSEGYHYDYPIRYDGGNLMHQLGHKERSGRNDFADQTPQLGQKASHGCIRLPSQVNQDGVNAYWLYTHLPYHTRLIILDDPEQRMTEAAWADAGHKEPVENLPPVDALPALQEGEKEIVITLGGDVVLGTRESWWALEESLPAYLEREGMAYPFAGLKELFEQDDMTLVNLECVLKDDAKGEDRSKAWRFRGLPEYAQALVLASIEQVNIANNHSIDYGTSGKEATKAALDAAGVAYSGLGFTYAWDCQGVRIGFGGCRETTFKQDSGVIARDIAALKSVGCEVIIYSCHWGEEYSPTRSGLQERMARAAVEAGADVVVGTHPHVVQGIDVIDGAVVLYSLGNLMFGGTHDMTTFDAALARLTLRFDDSGYLGCGVELIPVLTSGDAVSNNFQPVAAQGADRVRILAKIQADSRWQLGESMWFPAE